MTIRKTYRNEKSRPVSSFRFSEKTWRQLNDLVAWTEAKTRREVVEKALDEMWLSGCVPNVDEVSDGDGDA